MTGEALGDWDLGILELVQFPKTSPGADRTPSKLPSWVPDFMRFQVSGTPLTPQPMAVWESNPSWLYRPTGDSKRVVILESPANDERVLGISGFLVDTVDKVGIQWGDPAADDTLYLNYFCEVCTFCGISLPGDKKTLEQELGDAQDTKWNIPCRIMTADYVRCNPDNPRDLSLRRGIADDTSRFRRQLVETVQAFNTLRHENFMEYATKYRRFSSHYFDRLSLAQVRRRFRTQKMRYVGHGPLLCQPGDVVAVVFGARIPYMLRPRPDKGQNHFEYLGDAYCHGIMDGEAANGAGDDIYLV